MREGVWTRGNDTELQAWIAGESRTIVVTREAIDAHLGLSDEGRASMAAEDRRSFVLENIRKVIAAAKSKAEAADRAEDVITLRRGEL